jgi:hypothetical protein
MTVALLSMTVIFLCYAKNAGWPTHVKPLISLTEAQTKALEALKSRNGDYYCLAATVSRTFSKCDWELHFGSTNNTSVWVSVGTEGVRVSDSMFSY